MKSSLPRLAGSLVPWLFLSSVCVLPSCQDRFAELRRGDPDVPARVIQAAAGSNDPGLAAPLIAILERRIAGDRPLPTDHQVLAAVVAVGDRGDRSAVHTLSALLADPDLHLRLFVVEALALIGGEEAHEALECAARSDPEPRVRARARNFLARQRDGR
jgi:HEAT repeat protein